MNGYHEHPVKLRFLSIFLTVCLCFCSLQPFPVTASQADEPQGLSAEADLPDEQETDGSSEQDVSDGGMVTNDDISEGQAEDKSDSTEALPANVLRYDNTEQTDEDDTENQDSVEERDPFLAVELTGENDFPTGSHAWLEIIKEEALSGLVASLEEECKQTVTPVLPVDIAVFDETDMELENLEGISVKLSMEDTESLQDTILWHQKDDGTWEQLEYEVHEKTDTEFGYITFVTESFSPFLFAKVADTSADAPVNPKDSSIPDAGESKDTSEVQESENDTPNAIMPLADDVQPVIIDEFSVSFSSGASLRDGQYVWNPTEPADGHMFIYRVDYTTSGVYSNEKGAFRIELPLHILKDRDGNWADTFECPYALESEITENDEPDFVYSIDEDANMVTIYNYKPNFSGAAGYIEFSYTTSKTTHHYVDMCVSASVPATLYATNEAQTVTASSEAGPVSIDTHATISYTQKKKPDLYSTWQNSWGTKPEDADDYLYLVWTILSNINKNTAPYDFYLADDFTDLGGSVVGYRFAGQSTYTEQNYVSNQTGYGDRYDYVLTRHSKAEVEAILETIDSYEVTNNITATVSPVDHVDADTSASSSKKWKYETPKYSSPSGNFWSEKFGIYGSNSTVRGSWDVSDYTLAELLAGEKDSIDNLKFTASAEGYPYPWTLGDGADGTVNDALNGLYGQKKVRYEFTDDTFFLESTPLNDEDYEISNIYWSQLIRTAVFDENNNTFKESRITAFREEDAFSIYVRIGSEWYMAATYDMATSSYKDIDPQYIEKASGGNITFTSGINGVRFVCSNAYYRTKVSIKPYVLLNRTEHVLSLVGTEKTKVALMNQASFLVTQDDATLYSQTVKATDYIQKVTKESEIKKDVIQTRNNKSASRFEVTWRVTVQEKFTDNDGVHSIYQDSGIFYDLLPFGCVGDLSSLAVYASGKQLTVGAYDVSTVENYKDSGRTLLVVKIKEPTSTVYQFSYKTRHSYDSIQDYGKKQLNSVAYETGNEKIAGGYPDDGGNITDKDILTDLDTATDSRKFLYTEAVYDINILTAASTGLRKQVKNSSDSEFSYETTVHKGESYSYQVRLSNDATTMAKDIVFFDSLENFFQRSSETQPTIPSDWKGTLTGIDLSNLQINDIQSVVYLSKLDALNIQNHHDLTEQVDGEPVWVEWGQFVDTYGLEAAHAIAVDARKKTDGSDFILDKQKSLVFTLYMKSPQTEETGSLDPAAYNNIYVERTAIKEMGDEPVEWSQFYHQDYTKTSFRITGDISLRKLDKTDMETPVPGATYRLRGTSAYGTSYSLDRITDKNGEIQFSEVEKGTYELFEVSCSADWQLDTEVYIVTIDQTGTVTIDGLSTDGDTEIWMLSDKPRIHADITFTKVNSITQSSISGVRFQLSGTSDYDNEYLECAESNKIGNVTFSNIELGTYELTEIETPDGYIPSKPWTVTVDERSRVHIKQGDMEYELTENGYVLENEPYHSIRFVKTSSYGTNIYLAGAEFSLVGRSDYGTNVNLTAVSSSEEDGGLVAFDHLEPGTYLLKETKAPQDHELDDTTHTVVIQPDGTYTISGLEKTAFGNTTIYNFVDLKTAGMVTVTKVWEDTSSNDERPVPDITISTILPSKSLAGNTITFHASAGTFANGKTNEITYNSSNVIVDGVYTEPYNSTGLLSGWYLDKECTVPFTISEDGIPAESLSGDITVYAKYKTNILKTGSQFNSLIPSTATTVVFTDEVMPESATLIDVDADGDGGVVGWLDGTTFKVSTQAAGYKVYANADSSSMFKDKSSLKGIELEKLDTSMVTNMQYMFKGCSGLTSLDVSNFDTSMVTNMQFMFDTCKSLTSLNVSNFSTQNVTTMYAMFGGCNSLTTLDVSHFDTSKVTNMQSMFNGCSGLTSLDVSNFDTSKVTNMSYMFISCSGLTSLDVSHFDTSMVTNMQFMFDTCKSLTSLNGKRKVLGVF